ncbi:hypothetical protein LguiA_007135 [Lonicera macranthoides]
MEGRKLRAFVMVVLVLGMLIGQSRASFKDLVVSDVVVMVLSDGGEKQCRTVEGTRVSRWRRGDGGDGGYDGEEVIVVIGDGVRRGSGREGGTGENGF